MSFETKLEILLNTDPEEMEELINALPLQMLNSIARMATDALIYKVTFITNEMEDQLDKEMSCNEHK